jgi:RNA polymerase sigma-70 factor, ECF subfamily
LSSARQRHSSRLALTDKEQALESGPETATHRRDLTGNRVGGLRPTRGEVDAELEVALGRAQQGDEEGFALLWRALHPPLLRYLISRRDHAPEDVAAETWLHVIRDLRGFTGGINEFRAWLFTVARHRAIDQGRSRSARPAVAVSDPSEIVPAQTTPSAEETAEDRAATEAALRLVATLPPDQAEMVMLRVVAGLEVAVVAELVGKSPGAVRVAVHRALKSLSAALATQTPARPQRPSNDPQNRSAREVV